MSIESTADTKPEVGTTVPALTFKTTVIPFQRVDIGSSTSIVAGVVSRPPQGLRLQLDTKRLSATLASSSESEPAFGLNLREARRIIGEWLRKR